MVNGTRATSADQMNVILVSLDSGERVEVTEAFTIADLPMRAVESIGNYNALAAPARLVFRKADSPEVDFLIGCDVPEAYWVLDQKLGGRKEPYAAGTMFR
ncbi:unnamed protein product [Echinostoma caproni]|uniref:DUF1758 domain-containing protein n=1 Tax=Echinostoma caproni TaxID=27848 RepID=A0A183AXU9_9TREM|nr:unnamed protein product [Echinostoma caproni]